MKKIQISFMAVMFTTFFGCSCSLPGNNPETIIPDNQYFGLKQPGSVPEIFSPEISFFKEQKVGNMFYSPDGKKLFFQTADSFYCMQYDGEHWTNPAILNIIGIDGKVSSPTISPDGKCMLCTNKGDVLLCKWQGDSLSTPEKLPEQINSEKYECSSSMSMDQSIYYASDRAGTKGNCDIFYSKFMDGKYETPINLDNFNTNGSECGVFVSPKSDFIIFTGFHNRKDGLGYTDMHISFPLEDGSWSTPQNMGSQFNSKNAEWPLSVSPDGKYFFYRRVLVSNGNIEVYWVDITALNQFKSR